MFSMRHPEVNETLELLKKAGVVINDVILRNASDAVKNSRDRKPTVRLPFLALEMMSHPIEEPASVI